MELLETLAADADVTFRQTNSNVADADVTFGETSACNSVILQFFSVALVYFSDQN